MELPDIGGVPEHEVHHLECARSVALDVYGEANAGWVAWGVFSGAKMNGGPQHGCRDGEVPPVPAYSRELAYVADVVFGLERPMGKVVPNSSTDPAVYNCSRRKGEYLGQNLWGHAMDGSSGIHKSADNRLASSEGGMERA